MHVPHLAAELIGTDPNPFLATVGLPGSVALLEGTTSLSRPDHNPLDRKEYLRWVQRRAIPRGRPGAAAGR